MRFLRSARGARYSEESGRPGRWRRWVLRSLALLTAAAVLMALAALTLVYSLNQPWLKRRVVSFVSGAAGVDIDYRAVRIELLSGAQIEELVVHSPASVRPLAPDLVRVGRVMARWSIGSLLFGRGPALRRLDVSDVALNVVIDEQGKTSFDAFGTPSKPSPAVPLSHKASQFLSTAPPVGQLDVDGVTLALVRAKHNAVFDRIELRGVSIHLGASSAEPTERGWRIQAALGSPESPLALDLTRAPDGVRARARFWLTLDATSSALSAALDLRMTDQTFAASISADHWLHAEAGLRFDPNAGRTEVRLDHVEAGDGAATAGARIDLADTGDANVRSARADVDVARLLGWLPTGLVPVKAERAEVHCEVNSLVASPVPHLSEDGSVAVDADLSNVSTSDPAPSLRVGAGKLSLGARPAEGGGTAARGSVRLDEVRFTSGKESVGIDGLSVDVDGQQRAEGAIAGRAGVAFARAEMGGASPIVALDGHVALEVQRAYIEAKEPLATRGDLSFAIALGSLDVRSSAAHAVVDALSLRAHTTLEGHAPYAVELEAPMSRVHVMGRDGGAVLDAPAHIKVRALDVYPDVDRALASRGALQVAIDVGETQVSLSTTKESDAVDFALQATAPSLEVLRPLIPSALGSDAPWDQISARVRSSGRVERFGGESPALEESTEVAVDRPAFRGVAAKALSLHLQSHGTSLRHEAELDLRVQGLALEGSPGDEHAALSVTVDRARPSLQFNLETQGRATAKISGALSFDRSRRVVPYSLEAHLAGLAPLAPLAAKVHGLDAFDLSQLALDLSSHGALLGVVAEVAPDGSIAPESNPLATAALEGETDVRVAHFRWAKGDTAIAVPALAWHGVTTASGARRTLESRVEVGALHLDLGSRDLDLSGIGDEAKATVTGNLADPEIELAQRLSVVAVQQTILPEYPLGELSFALSAARSRDGVVRISDMKVVNGLGGTELGVTGNVELDRERRTLSLAASLSQDLERLSRIPERFKGRGKVAVEANVTSPDLAHYQVRAVVKGEDVAASLSRGAFDLDSANGEVPISVALKIGKDGVALERTETRNPYSMLRFADQHPLLNRSGFLSIGRLKTPLVSIAPLAGNLQIDQNIVSLSQFELGMRGGRITGQCALDWEGLKSTLELHVRATGVQSTHGEPFDGNIAVVISAADRTINGRAEILRIGERHLLDLLDLQDPLHVDTAMNRIRTALNFGYPKSLRLTFDHGFASAHLELGGLAQLISIGELRGIPMGPLVDKMIAPMLARPNPSTNKETP